MNNLDRESLDRILKRGVAEIIVREEMVELLRSGKKLRLKEGFDPSFPDIHLGHMVTLRKLHQFQELGHQVVLIVGDWTAQIGDPSGASITRPMLSAEQVKANAQSYMEQFFKVVDKDKTEVRWQSEWFGKFGLADVIHLTSKFTVAQMLQREDFANRFSTGNPVSVTELLYPMMQAYDSVAIRSNVEFGGTDQKFNLLVGRELQATVGQRPQQVFMAPLLIGTDGSRKMSKSLGNYIGVAEPPSQMYGKVMSITDGLIMNYFELLTDVSDEELTEFRATLAGGTTNPMALKKRLAREIVAQLYDEQAASEAEASFVRVHQERELPQNTPVCRLTEELLEKIMDSSIQERDASHQAHLPVGTSGFMIIRSQETQPRDSYKVSVSSLLTEIGLVKSRSEARRMIEQNAVDIDGKTVTDIIWDIKIGSIIKVGKHRFVKIVNCD